MNEKDPAVIRPRLRIIAGKDIAFGPGKAQLLQALRATGTISGAARQTRMSYMRAWTLVHTMNSSFREPLVVALRGGRRGGGGAQLTALGREVLELYERMDKRCLAAVQPEWRRLQKLLRP